jgi:GT2 family glycosyltransferase
VRDATASSLRTRQWSASETGAAGDYLAGMTAPAALRLVDLECPLVDLTLRSERLGVAHRSLLAVVRFDGEPLGAVAVPVGPRGRVSGEWLADLLRCDLEPELRDALAQRGLDLPESLPRDGIQKRFHRRDPRARSRLVSVVVTASPDPALLARCLRSIFACDDPNFEVIVVGRRSRSRATMRMLDEQFAGESRLRCVEDAGAGVSHARNAGLARADGEVVMFTSDDVIVDALWIGRCRAAFDRDRDVACVTGLILPPELGSDSQLRSERLATGVTGFCVETFHLPEGQATHPFFYYRPGAMGSGANTALRADVGRELGGFDAALGPATPTLGGEDLDLYVRVLGAGHTVVHDPSVIVWQERGDGAAQAGRSALGEGVSLGAALTKQLVAAPEGRRLLRAVPAGLRYELDPGVAADTVARHRALDWLRRVGVALGLALYAVSALRLALMRWARRERSREWRRTATRADRALVAVAAAVCLLAPMLVAAGAPSGLRFPAVLALLCLAPGTAILTALGTRRMSAEAGLVLGASLGVAAVLAQTMLWLGAWWPKAFLYLLAVACLVPLLARCRELVPRVRRVASAPWLTDVELAGPVCDLRPPRDPTGARSARARVLARLHGQPIGVVELPLRDGTVGARDLVAAIDAELSPALAGHLARDGLQPAPLTPKGLPSAESPPCAAGGFYGEREPFVSVILSASDDNGAASLAASLEAVLGVDYPAYEVVVARVGCSDAGEHNGDPAHPDVHYVYEPSADPWEARRRAVGAAGGDVLVFTDSDVVVDANWIRVLVQALSPAARVGCVTGPVHSRNGGAPESAVNFAVSREALRVVGGFEGIRTSPQTAVGAHDALTSRFLLAGWAVSHEPSAPAWRLARRDRPAASAAARVASRLAGSTTIRKPAALHAAVLGVAGVAWVLSLEGADLSRMAGLGLLDALPASYFVAFGLLVAGFIAGLTSREPSGRLLWLYAFALILVLHATTALLYDEPRYPWTFNHLGVIALIGHAGAVDRSVDIYNNWPSFFALVAWLSAVTGVSAISYAAWAQVFFNLADLVALRFALRGVTNDERLLWTASLFFLLGNWVGQDYLAPQAFAFLLSLVVLGLCLRCGPGAGPPMSAAARWWVGVLDRVRHAVLRRSPVDEQPGTGPLSPGAAVVVGSLCYLAVVVSHQLTPVTVLAGALGLALVARRIPLWVPLAMGLVEAWWLWRAWPYLSLHFSLLDPAPSSSAAPPGYSIGDGLPGLALVAYGVRAELLILLVLAAIGLVRRLRKGQWDVAAATLLVAPLVVVLQSYGGEGRYRIYLFALPWLCFFAAAAVSATRVQLGSLRHRSSVALTSTALAACLLPAYLGLELMNRVDPDDVASASWFERHAPTDSVLAGVTSNFPRRLSARYPAVYHRDYPGAPSLTEHVVYRRRLVRAADLRRIERTLREVGSPHTFVTLTASQERYARLYGLLAPGWMRSLSGALRASPDFRLVYRRGSSSIFQFRPGRAHPAEAIR